MRPKANQSGEELYECYSCGRRVGSADGRTCGACGGTLRNIGRCRDL